ncbi:MAG: nucleotide exchange factor GrpE [Clostridia bacterium]|nr:nucleotide exchange factor GrpE [Clostridia bacterium]
MSNDNRTNENREEMESSNSELQNEQNNSDKEQNDLGNEETASIKSQLAEKTKQCEEYLSMLQRTAAEFDNYKKRTAKEKEALHAEVTGDVLAAFLPIIDNLERAIQASSANGGGGQSLKEGIELVFRQIKDTMKNFGVEEIKGVGEIFDPQVHNAVMHIDDESYGENVVVEEFQKGYTLKGKVIRHSMVKVAN